MEVTTRIALSNPEKKAPTMTLSALQALDYDFNQTFYLVLSDRSVLFVERIVRLVPKVRLVAFGTWEGKSVVAKLFFSSKHAKRRMQNDMMGIEKLLKHHVPTPAICFQGHSIDHKISVLLFERILDAQNLGELFAEKINPYDLLPMLRLVVQEIATQHVYGIRQRDLHLHNYLISKNKIYTLDGGQIDIFPDRLPKKQSMQNLALFFAQLGSGKEEIQRQLFYYYAELRGWLLKSHDLPELFTLINGWNIKRWQRFAKKIFRRSTDFFPIRGKHSQGMMQREKAGPELVTFLHNPQAAFNESAEILKAGRSATVIRMTLDQRDIVVKRYNMKSIRHFLRRMLRKTRAEHSWHLAQKLNLFDIATAKPIAYLEKKWLCFRGTSYYVCEYVSNQHLGQYLMQHAADETKLTEIMKRTADLLKNLAKLEITHGDLKMTNILLDTYARPILIDLDGAREHSTLSKLHRAWHAEVERFLANFNDQPEWQKRFKKEFYNS